MAVPFPRSTRSLSADSFRYTLIGLMLAGLLLIAWCFWFFGATVTIYERSEEAHLQEEVITAEFSKEQLHRIVRGQRARFFPDGGIAGRIDSLAAVVAEANRFPEHEKGQVSLILLAESSALVPSALLASRLSSSGAPLAGNSVSGRVEIEVERLSPAGLALRSSGLLGTAEKSSNTP